MKILDVLFVEEENSFVVKSETDDGEDFTVIGPEFQFLKTPNSELVNRVVSSSPY